jgi:hypothetical protein
MNNLLRYNYNGNVNKVTYNGENVTMLPHGVKTDPNDKNVFEKQDYIVYCLITTLISNIRIDSYEKY